MGNFDDNKKILGKKFHLTVLQATPEQLSIFWNCLSYVAVLELFRINFAESLEGRAPGWGRDSGECLKGTDWVIS